MDMGLNQNDQSMALPPFPPITGSQNWLMSSHVMGTGDIIGTGVDFSEDQQPYTNPQQLLYPFTSPNNQAPPLAFPSSSSTDLSLDFSQFLSSQLERQTTEMEAFLQLQTECSFVGRNEAKRCSTREVCFKSRGFDPEKDNELALAKQTNMEIEQCILRTDAQVKSWQKLALEKESIVADLSYKLKKVQERIQMMNSGAPDADSTCGGDTFQDKSNMELQYGNCKMCHAQRSCVLLFPCKHLCCCKSCEASVKLCPVCESLKKGSMEIFFA